MQQRRIAEYGIRIGELPAGPRDKLSDVPGVRVGHWTLHDTRSHTGVTLILPGEGSAYRNKFVAACHVANGFGKTAGLVQVEELGMLETPIALTGTLNVGRVQDALVQLSLEEAAAGGYPLRSVNPVVGECNDGILGDNSLRAVGEAEVRAALADARPDFDEGAVGAGAGMVCHELKGGIGSASRMIRLDGVDYTVGVLVQANHGQLNDLRIDGKLVGPIVRRAIKELRARPPRPEEKGSCMMILATDLPVDSRQLRRVLWRCPVGLVRCGSFLGHGSGDVCIGFSTANRVSEEEKRAIVPVTVLNERFINRAFRAAAEATEEAVLNALVSAETVTGKDGTPCHSLSEVLPGVLGIDDIE